MSARSSHAAPPVSGSTLRRSRLATPQLSSGGGTGLDPIATDSGFSLHTRNSRPNTVDQPSSSLAGSATSPSPAPLTATPRRQSMTSASLFATSTLSPRQQHILAQQQQLQQQQHTASLPSLIPTNSEWRSGLLSLEVRLRELAADGPTEPPSTFRIEEVLRLFDTFSSMIHATYGEPLRLFRIEFCRAIFSGVSGTGSNKTQFAQGGDAAQVPFFEKIDKMLRERNILEAELEAVETDHNVADLKRQLAKLSSLIPFYEQEVGRLTRENERQLDEITRYRQDLDLTQSAHDKAFRNLEDEVRRVTAENREMQLQVFRLSKDNREQLSGQSMYLHMKQQKTDRLREMFSTGDEFAGLQLMCHQLEHSMNSIMTEFDMEYTKCIPNEMASLRVKFNRRVSLILEEMHFCEHRLEQLGDADMVRNFSVLRASTLFELEIAKIIPLAERSATTGRGRSGSNNLLKNNSQAKALKATDSTPGDGAAALAQSLQQDVGAKRLEWVKKFLGSVVEARDLLKIGTPQTPQLTSATTPRSVGIVARGSGNQLNSGAQGSSSGANTAAAQEFPYHTYLPGHFLDKLFARPLLDVSSNKFMVGIDIHAYAGGSSSHIRTMNYLDPTSLIDLPPRTSHVKLKFLNPMIRPTVVNATEEETAQITTDALSSHLEWSPQNTNNNNSNKPVAGASGGAAAPSVGSTSGAVSALRGTGVDDKQQTSSPSATTTDVVPASEPSHWRLYRKLFRNYRPNLPRVLESHHLDFVMYQVSQRHAQRMGLRYEMCRTTASQRSTNSQMTRVMADRLFRDEYQPIIEFQISLVEVLEARYSFPELVGKGLYEVLTSLEAMAGSPTAPQAHQYLACIGGAEGYSASYLTSGILHSVASFWPASLHQPDQEVHQRDATAVLRYVYPADGAIRIDTDALIQELLLSCEERLTLRTMRTFLTHNIQQCDEGFVKRFKELFAYRADVVQWTELEFPDLFDVLKGFVGDDTAAASVPTFLESCCVLQKATRIPLQELSFIAASTVLAMALNSKRI
ncbi:Hypothetical protein, putative [Bodo saltans]|uniref:Uncharacterized protein n=1 Tax=Bodo saltans TaxID=75058 RepID=A0A0S4KHD9_BODSA|nr:Hypothetical protein, putative [Bodo saltans]|eukprot:CUI15056.1 Hypothetical protein, putative [Bodo saltans]